MRIYSFLVILVVKLIKIHTFSTMHTIVFSDDYNNSWWFFPLGFGFIYYQNISILTILNSPGQMVRLRKTSLFREASKSQ